jgi:glycosyltransferase involved in cell wall biosynthesis
MPYYIIAMSDTPAFSLSLLSRDCTGRRTAPPTSWPAPSSLPHRPGRPYLSIIIPAYNEEKRLGVTLEKIHSFFASRAAGLGVRDIEILVVDDGSSDGTARVVRKLTASMPELRFVKNEINRGKGYSVKRGICEARGSVALFTDADLSLPIEEAGKLLTSIAEGNDVAIGSRGIDRSLMGTPPPLLRTIAGGVFNTLVRVLVGLPFHDTQCGLKAFSRDRCRPIFEQQRIEGFGFDPEILFLARRHGLKTAEVAVRSSHDSASKVHLWRDSARMFRDLLYIRWNSMCRRYMRSTRVPVPGN